MRAAALHSLCTPLHRAALEGQADVLRSLLLFAANSTLRDDEGRTALDCALAAPHKECIALLRSAEEQQRAITQGVPARCDEDDAEEKESWCSSSDAAVAAAPISPRHPSRHPSRQASWATTSGSSASEVSQRSEAAEVPSAVDLNAAWACSLETGLAALPLALQPPHPPLRALSSRSCAYSPPCIALLCRERRAPQPASAPASPRRVGAMLGSMLRRVHVSDAADAQPAREGKLHSVFGVSYQTRGWLDVHLPLLAWAADAETLYLSAPGRPSPGKAALLCSRLLAPAQPVPRGGAAGGHRRSCRAQRARLRARVERSLRSGGGALPLRLGGCGGAATHGGGWARQRGPPRGAGGAGGGAARRSALSGRLPGRRRGAAAARCGAGTAGLSRGWAGEPRAGGAGSGGRCSAVQLPGARRPGQRGAHAAGGVRAGVQARRCAGGAAAL